ncbi:MAG: amidohydrolase [Vicingaceae bacterium]
MSDLKISLIQTELFWENKRANFEFLARKIAELKGKTDIVLLPEMFSTGFTMNAKILAESMDGNTISWMHQQAKEYGLVVAGSFICNEQGKYYNRFVWMPPDGNPIHYDKKHLFRMAKEEAHYSPGNHLKTIEYNNWKIRPMVCYDLRFPVWSSNRVNQTQGSLNPAFDVLLYVANWPKVRVSAWDILLRARAVENQVYCLGVNRVGEDGNGKVYSGHSAVIEPKGSYLLEPVIDIEGSFTVALNKSYLEDYRKKFPQGLDADQFELTN